MALTLASRKDSVADFIAWYQRLYGYPPSVRDIADELGISASNTYRVLQAMVNDGELKAVKGLARTWRLVG